MNKIKPKTVGEYISKAPVSVRAKLKQIRSIIKAAAPKALEKISYGMPYYAYKGAVAYFALSKNHIGLYVPPPIIKMHKHELQKYKTSTATVQFALNSKLPAVLIKKLVKARLKYNLSKTNV